MPHSDIDTLELGQSLNRYGPTAARPVPGSKKRLSTPTVDMHAHVLIPEAAAYAAPFVNFADIPLANFSNEPTREVNRAQDGNRQVALKDFDDRIAVLDAMGIDFQVVAPPPLQCYYTIPLENAVKASRMVNDGLAEFVGRRPDRFAALGTVPMQDAAEAVKELDYCMKLGFKGVQILTNIHGAELSDPAFVPFWKRAEELGALVMIHPNGYTQGERFSDYYFSNIIGNPLDTAVALHKLIFSGTLERHPDLKLLAVHGGGYLPSYSGRIDHAWGARADCRAGLPHPPTHYLRKVFFDNVVFTAHQLRYLVEVFGADQIVMGTDYPYDMCDYDTVELVISAGLSAEDTAKVAGGNARRILGLD